MGMADGDGERVGGVGAFEIGLWQQDFDHHLDLQNLLHLTSKAMHLDKTHKVYLLLQLYLLVYILSKLLIKQLLMHLNQVRKHW